MSNEIEKNQHQLLVMQDRDYLSAYECAISVLKVIKTTTPFALNNSEWIDLALNDARYHIDQLIEDGKFDQSKIFLKKVKDNYREVVPASPARATIENLLEFYEYRIHDREVLETKYIDKLTRQFEKKSFEVLGFFSTFIAIVFAFVNNETVRVSHYRIPSFIALAVTILLSWLCISIVANSEWFRNMTKRQ